MIAPASNRQLWRLNTLGRLALTDDAEPISSAEASVVIATAAASGEFASTSCTLDGDWGATRAGKTLTFARIADSCAIRRAAVLNSWTRT